MACEEEKSTLVFDSITFSQDYEATIEVTLDQAVGKDAISKQSNTTIEQALIKGIPNTENATNLSEALQQFDNDFIDFKTTFEDETQVWELALETEITYQSKQVITIAVSTYADTGGAHGNDSIQLLNINPETGKALDFDAIISNKTAFETTAKLHFENHLKTENKSLSDYFFGEAFELPEHFGFSEEGVILLYNVYEIATYDQGYTEFVIPFEDASSFLNVR